jgi:hypothetical protein
MFGKTISTMRGHLKTLNPWLIFIFAIEFAIHWGICHFLEQNGVILIQAVVGQAASSDDSLNLLRDHIDDACIERDYPIEV